MRVGILLGLFTMHFSSCLAAASRPREDAQTPQALKISTAMCTADNSSTRVCDPDNVLSTHEHAVTDQLLQFIGKGESVLGFDGVECRGQEVGIKLAVVLLKSVPSEGIAPVKQIARIGNHVQTAWSIGDKGCHNGAVIVVDMESQSIYVVSKHGSSGLRPKALRDKKEDLDTAVLGMQTLLSKGWVAVALNVGLADIAHILGQEDDLKRTHADVLYQYLLYFLDKISANFGIDFKPCLRRWLNCVLLSIQVTAVVLILQYIASKLGFTGWSRWIDFSRWKGRLALRQFYRQEESGSLSCSQRFDSSECPLCLQNFSETTSASAPVIQQAEDRPDSTFLVIPRPHVLDNDTFALDWEGPQVTGTTSETRIAMNVDQGAANPGDDRDTIEEGAIDFDSKNECRKQVLRCGHTFHAGCIRLLLLSCHLTCPICRERILDGISESVFCAESLPYLYDL